MEKPENLKQILAKYDFADLLAKLQSLEADQKALFIGILGEFNAGKSTLVNAMLGKKILPAMEKPTTARITEVLPESGRESLGFFLRDPQGNITPATVLDFDKALLTSGSEVAVIKTSANDLLLDGYCIVDTPGLASLDETHTDITFGYLPLLDGAIVCQDINKGGLTESLKAFLSKREVRPFLNRMVFLLTRADTKQPESAESIRQAFINELAALISSLGCTALNLDEKVLAISPSKMLTSGTGKKALSNVFEKVFLAGRQAMLKDRIEHERRLIVRNAIARLHRLRDNLNLDRSEYTQKRASILKELAELENQQSEIELKLDRLKPELSRLVTQHTSELRASIISGNQSDINTAHSTFQSKLQTAVSELLRTKLAASGGLVIDSSIHDLQGELGKLTSVVEVGKLVATAAMIAIAMPASGPASLGSAIASEIIEGAVGAKIANMTRGSRLGDFIRTVNPAELVGNYLLNHLKEKTIDQKLQQLSASISLSILEQVKEIVYRELIGPSVEACKTAKKQIDQLLAAEKDDAADIQAQRDGIARDILVLS